LKIKIDIDCGPEEARAFLGLPDMRPIHDLVINEMRDRLLASARALDPDAMVRTWFPLGGPWLEALQNLAAGAAKANTPWDAGKGKDK